MRSDTVWRFIALYLLPLPWMLMVFLGSTHLLGVPEVVAFYVALVCVWYAFVYTVNRLSTYPTGDEVMRFTLRLWLTFGIAFLIGGAIFRFAFAVGLPEWWAAGVGLFVGYFSLERAANHVIPLPERDDHVQGRRPPVPIAFTKRMEEALLSFFTKKS